MQTNDKVVVALYRAHFNAKEIAALTGIAYQRVAAIIRGLKVISLEKHDRFKLVPAAELSELLDMIEEVA